MTQAQISADYFDLLNQALSRELHVSIQYMLQHAVVAAAQAVSGQTWPAAQVKFLGSDNIYLPGKGLKKTAITEMRHAEAIAERIKRLGGVPTTDTGPITLGETPGEMLEADIQQETEAIELYSRIIVRAGQEHDEATARLFERILSDEQKHHSQFVQMLQRQ
jgi:bacterioferritin